jgi:hypothetical protein
VNLAARAVKRRYLGRDPFWRTQLPDERVRLTRNLEELDEAISAFRDAEVRVVAVLGGDGSLHHLVDAVLRRYEEADAPIVLPLAGGTLNGLARALGAGGPPERVLRSALAALADGAPPIRARHVLRVSDARDGRTRHGFSLATGLPYRIAEHYYRAAEPGMADAVRCMIVLPLGAALFCGKLFENLRLDVQADGAPWLPEAPHTLVASVLDSPLLWFHPFGTPLATWPRSTWARPRCDRARSHPGYGLSIAAAVAIRGCGSTAARMR